MPLASEVVAIETAGLKVKLNGAVAACELASVTCIVKLLTPLPVGVPVTVPVLGASARPAGKFPEMIDHVYGVVPPEAASVALYAMFCMPLASEVVVIE